jgi:alpha-amylase
MPTRARPALACVLALVLAACGTNLPPETAAPTSSPATSTGPVGTPAASDTACTPAQPDAAPSDGSWWHDSVVYEVYVRSFADSDGDGIGDLRGLIDHLDDLNDGDPATTDDLGVTALWLMPVTAAASDHGYDVTDYRTVEPDYGTNADMQALVEAAHARGIRVILDLVINHTSDQHPWFVDASKPGSAHQDWYLWSNDPPTVAGPGGRPVWHPDGKRWYYGYFSDTMPDLNLENPDVTAEIDRIARFWLEDVGVDGFRIDAARHLIEDGATLQNTDATFAWLEAFRDQVHQIRPDALVLGEVWDSTSIASRYVREGALDLVFEFDLAAQMLLAVRGGDSGSLRYMEGQVLDAYPGGDTFAPFLSNHDQDRTFDVVGRDVARAKQAATLLLTSAGTPVIYYGEEIGLRGRKPDPRIRTPMPWTGDPDGFGFTTGQPYEPMADGAKEANVAAEATDPDSLLSHYRDLIRLRDSVPALHGDGSTYLLDASDRAVYGVLRHARSGDSLVLVSNLSDQPVDDVTVSLDTGPLCGGVGEVAVLPLSAGLPEAVPDHSPVINSKGGFASWRIGTMEPHQDVLIELVP